MGISGKWDGRTWWYKVESKGPVNSRFGKRFKEMERRIDSITGQG